MRRRKRRKRLRPLCSFLLFMKTQRVLFMCIHNSARSQMAEAFLNVAGGDRFEAESAGLEPGRINPLVVEVMREIGVDLSQKGTRDVFEVYRQGKQYDCRDRLRRGFWGTLPCLSGRGGAIALEFRRPVFFHRFAEGKACQNEDGARSNPSAHRLIYQRNTLRRDGRKRRKCLRLLRPLRLLRYFFSDGIIIPAGRKAR